MNKSKNTRKITNAADDYFGYMAQNYPVMCASDEFYFFPRVKKAGQFLNILDSLSAQKIKQDISCIKNIRRSLETIDTKTIDLEELIDLTLLRQSMSSFIREFQDFKIYRHDPTLYLKVILFGIYQFLDHPRHIRRGNIEDTLSMRLSQIPRLLSEAKKNLSKKIAPAYLETASAMIDSLIDYLKPLPLYFNDRPSLLRQINALVKKSVTSLDDFKKFILKRTSQENFLKDKQLFKDILNTSFVYHRDIDEIFDIANEEYHVTLCELKRLANTVNPHKTWQEILSKYRPDVKDVKSLLALYSGQIQKIKRFLKQNNIITIPEAQSISVRLTPKFMQPIRASASYNSSIGISPKDTAYFYITADFANIKKEAAKPKFSIIHNEYMFLTAHETYPGHHLLDVTRALFKNPIRQQIESPLFYEGWASYAEGLIDEFGYIKEPVQKLVGLRRRAWRAVRAMLDTGIRIGKLNLGEAGLLLKNLGYETRLVKSMLRHYLVMPGYQLCYTMGKYEITRLRKKFAAKLGLRKFHDLIVNSGEIPFDLLEKRIKKHLCQKNS